MTEKQNPAKSPENPHKSNPEVIKPTPKNSQTINVQDSNKVQQNFNKHPARFSFSHEKK